MLAYGSINKEQELNHVADLDNYLREWNTSKVSLYKMLGETLIYKQPICFEMPTKAIAKEISSKICEEGHPIREFVKAFRDFLNRFSTHYLDLVTERACDNYATSTGIIYNKESDAFWVLYDLVEAKNLASNIFDQPDTEIRCPDGSTIKINKGCKIVRMLGKIAEVYNIEGYEEFRIAHSICTNTKKVQGNLCLSIHPLDYMTMSDNENNWSSCMSWRRVGDYRMGTVEMMNSDCVVVAYVETNNKKLKIDNEHFWNSKIWRELFIVRPELILGVKPYPYEHNELESTALNLLKDFAEKTLGWGNWYDGIREVSNNENNEFDGDEKFIEIDSQYMYNDIYDYRKAYVSKDMPAEFVMNYSGRPICIICGDYIDNDSPDGENAHYLSCERCSPHIRCYECGEYLDNDNDAIYYIDDTPYCAECYNRIATYCDGCDEIVADYDTQTVHLFIDEYNTQYKVKLCEECVTYLRFHVFSNGVKWTEDGPAWYSPMILVANLMNTNLEKYSDYIRETWQISDDDWTFFLKKITNIKEQQEKIRQEEAMNYQKLYKPKYIYFDEALKEYESKSCKDLVEPKVDEVDFSKKL